MEKKALCLKNVLYMPQVRRPELDLQEVWWSTQPEVPAHWERRLGCLEQVLHLDKPYRSSLGSIKGPQ